MRPFQIRSHGGVLALIWLGLTLAACGSTGGGAETSVPAKVAQSNFSTHNNDRDNDGDNNDDDEKVLGYGHPADAADRQKSIALVTRYFAVAATGNGTAGCGMLVPLLAETIVENDGHSPTLRGKTCAVVLSKLFGLHHRELVQKRATLKVIAVRADGTKELIVLDFPTIPEVRQITARRIGGTWKLLDLLDGILE